MKKIIEIKPEEYFLTKFLMKKSFIQDLGEEIRKGKIYNPSQLEKVIRNGETILIGGFVILEILDVNGIFLGYDLIFDGAIFASCGGFTPFNPIGWEKGQNYYPDKEQAMIALLSWLNYKIERYYLSLSSTDLIHVL